MKHRSGLRNWTEYLAAAALLGTLRFTPRRLAGFLARGSVRLLDLAVPRLRRAALRNLALALPETSQAERARIVRGVFRSVAGVLVAFARLPDIDKRNIGEWIGYEGAENYEAARAQGHGVLFASAHFGNWELSSVAHALRFGPLQELVRPLDNPLLDRLVERRRRHCGNRTIRREGSARPILKALAANETIGILIDQNTTADEGVFVDFFGVPACATGGIARLAAHSGAVVIPSFAIWRESERRFVLVYCPALEITGSVVEDTQQLQKRLEGFIRQYPDQWLWIHRRWKTRPTGEPEIYAENGN